MKNKARLLRDGFRSRPILRIAGAHNAMGAKLIERNAFDGVWASGLEISASHGVPDANILTMTEFLQAANSMNEASSLPVVCDCDTGFGNASNVIHMVKKYDAAGMAAVVIEDKLFPKVNSFVAGRQELAPVEEFMGKIQAAKNAQTDGDFMVFARVEALIAGWGLEEALRRAYAYAEAGADGIVIHSKATTPDEIFSFAAKWKGSIPLTAIPTTYYEVTGEELARRGFKMVIYANHGLRASVAAMDSAFGLIRRTDSTAEVENRIASMEEVFGLQGMPDLKRHEERYAAASRVQAVIPAAGDPRGRSNLGEIVADKPLCMAEVGGKALLDRQIDLLSSCGIRDITVVGGYLGDRIRASHGRVIQNPDYARTGTAGSVLASSGHWKSRCVFVYSDIVFDRGILERLIESPHQATIVIDRAFQTLPPREKALDLVVADDLARGDSPRRLEPGRFRRVRRIGRRLDRAGANYEFIGMAYFQEEGLEELRRAWDEAQRKFRKEPFYEAAGVREADLNDLLQYLIDRGFPVHGLEIEHGWSEIHSLEDLERVRAHYRVGVRQ